MNSIERLVPVPPMSGAGFTVFSEIRTSGQPPLALRDAFQAGRIPVRDLPEITANTWTRDDSPTSDLGEADWLVIFRGAGFFTYPPLAVRQPDGTRVPLARPSSPVTLYRGSLADRIRRMSWTCERDLAEQLGRRHTPYGAAILYKATVVPGAILAYLERRGEGWTVVIDPAGLTSIEPWPTYPAHGESVLMAGTGVLADGRAGPPRRISPGQAQRTTRQRPLSASDREPGHPTRIAKLANQLYRHGLVGNRVHPFLRTEYRDFAKTDTCPRTQRALRAGYR